MPLLFLTFLAFFFLSTTAWAEHQGTKRMKEVSTTQVELSSSDLALSMQKLLKKYFNTIGIYPKEFLSLSDKEREAYVRGVMDSQVIWGKRTRMPSIEKFVLEQGEYESIMPWTLAKLVGLSCPWEKFSRFPTKDPKYTQATTQLVLGGLAQTEKNKMDLDKKLDIRRIFLRGALDGKTFSTYPYLLSPDSDELAEHFIDYYTCLMEPGTLDAINKVMPDFNFFGGESLDKSFVYAVSYGEERAFPSSKHPSCLKTQKFRNENR